MVAKLPESDGGTAGVMKSGNFGVVTTGAGMSFGAQAVTTAKIARTDGFRIKKSLPRDVTSLPSRPGRGDDAGHRPLSRCSRLALRGPVRAHGGRGARSARGRPDPRDRT